MKLILLSFSALALAVLPGCTDSEASAVKSAERPPENGAQFKKGEGISLTDTMAKSIDLKTAEVTEMNIAPRLSITLRPLSGGKEASGWLTAAQAAKVQSGAVVEFANETPGKGRVLKLETPAGSSLGEPEVFVSMETPLEEGTEVKAYINLPESEAVATIPRSALLPTAEGNFVYTKNGKYYFRMGVTVGAMNDDHVEVTEGLFTGDEVVTSPVMSLWMAELQVLRGGKACTCGH